MSSAVKSLLRNRSFILLWCAYGISATGDHMSEMAVLAKQNALSLEVDITPLQARMTFLFMLPFFVLGPLTGWVADRFPRRWVMILADLVRAGIMLSFAVLIEHFGRVWPVWGPFVPLGMVGIFAALFSPSRSSLVPMLVGGKELVSANAMISGLGMIATMFAAGVGGYLADRGLVQTAFNLDAGTFLLSAFLVFLIDPRRSAPTPRSPRHAEPFIKNLAGGMRYVASHRRVAQLIVIAMIFWFAGAGVRSVIPAIVKNVYHGGFQAMALFPVWLGIGLVTGSVLLSIAGHAVRGEIVITWSMFGAGLGVFGLAGTVFLPFAPATAYGLGAMCVFVMGVFGAGVAASYNALIQRFVPNQYRGRVYGIVNVATVGGLLLATGALGIPTWSNLDQWSGYILLGIAGLMIVTGATTLAARHRRSGLGGGYSFFRSLNEVVARFWWRLECVTPCTIPHNGPAIITANHSCYIDPLLFYAVCRYRPIAFMIAAEYNELPIFKHIIRFAECIPIRRGENDFRAVKETMRRLRRGEVVGLFIQGGIRPRDSGDDLKRGVAMLALRTGAKVIPAHIGGTRYRSNILSTMLARHNARLTFGQPVDLTEFAGRKGQDVLDAATAKIFAAVNALAPRVEGLKVES